MGFHQNIQYALIESDLPEKVDSATAATTKRTNDKGFYTLSAQQFLDFGNHGRFVFKRRKKAKCLALPLSRKGQRTSGGTSKPCMETESSNPTTLRVVQKFDVIQGTASAMESRQHLGPACLLLVAMSELDVGVG